MRKNHTKQHATKGTATAAPPKNLSERELNHLIETLLAPGDTDSTPARPVALLLLLDEIERDQSGNALSLAQRAAIRKSNAITDRFRDLFVAGVRSYFIGAGEKNPSDFLTVAAALKGYEDELMK